VAQDVLGNSAPRVADLDDHLARGRRVRRHLDRVLVCATIRDRLRRVHQQIQEDLPEA